MAEEKRLGQAQLEILRYVQDHSPATVRQVAEFLSEKRGLTRTTALNVMERLREKGYLVREQIDGLYYYSPSLSKPNLLRSLVSEFVAKTLGGSLEPFVAYLAEEVHLTEEEHALLQQRIQQMYEEQDKGESASADARKKE